MNPACVAGDKNTPWHSMAGGQANPKNPYSVKFYHFSLESTWCHQPSGKWLCFHISLLAVCWNLMAPLRSQYYIVLDQLPLALPVNGGNSGPFLKVVIVLKMSICGFRDAERPLSPLRTIPRLIIPCPKRPVLDSVFTGKCQ